MDPALSRLCAIPGDRDLTIAEARAVLDVSRNFIQRLTSPDRPGKPQKHKLEVKRYPGRGDDIQTRVAVPRASIVRYIVQAYSGERTVILTAIKTLCPHYLPAVLDLIPGAAPLPANVVSINEGRKPRAKRPVKDPFEGHPMLFTA